MKIVKVSLIVAGALMLLALAGCGKAKQVAEGVRMANDARDGKMTVKGEKGETAVIETSKDGEKGGKVTVTDQEGKTTTTEIGTANVSEQDVGIAFYPGATVGNSSTSSSTGKENAKISMVLLTTTDSFADVATFYKDKYAQGNTVIEQPDNLMITVKEGENSGKMIMVASKEGKVEIMIHSAAGG